MGAEGGGKWGLNAVKQWASKGKEKVGGAVNEAGLRTKASMEESAIKSAEQKLADMKAAFLKTQEALKPYDTQREVRGLEKNATEIQKKLDKMGDAANRVIQRLGALRDLVDVEQIKQMVRAKEPELKEDLAKIREKIAKLTASVANNDALESAVATA